MRCRAFDRPGPVIDADMELWVGAENVNVVCWVLMFQLMAHHMPDRSHLSAHEI